MRSNPIQSHQTSRPVYTPVSSPKRRDGRRAPCRTCIETLEDRRLLSGSLAISISDVALAEGQNGQTAFVFTVSLSAPSNKRVSMDYRTADASAVAGSDYQAVSGKLQFAPGEMTKTITVFVNGDVNPESTDSFLIDLSRVRNGSIEKGRGWGTILDDDGYVPPPLPPAQPGDPGDGCTPDHPYYPNC